MPELPEVEAVRRKLSGWVEGRTITDVISSDRHRGVAGESLRSLLGRQIERVSRLGKYLILHMGPQVLVIHLGMSGRLLSYDEKEHLVAPHDHLRISIDDGRVIVFQDHRRFGRMFLSSTDLSALPVMGPDPTQIDITPVLLAELLLGRRGKLKPALMNQAVLAGIGNIYASEILWAAKLAPSRQVSSLGVLDFEYLAASILDVLNRAIDAGGATLDDYRGTNGEMGNFDAKFSVFTREGKGCLRCHTPIAAQRLAGRITYWCPSCQA
jgi:formamidopyrimidine-DNA glycosylase